MARLSVVTITAVMLLAAQLSIAAGTIGPIRADRTVQGAVIGSPTPRPTLLAATFPDRAHGFLSTQLNTCAGARCTSLLTTSDGGGSWRTVHTGIAFSNLSFVSPQLGFGVSDAGRLLVTHDAGRHWTAVATAGGKAARIDFVDAQDGWLLPASLGGHLYRTVNGGRSWIRLPFECGRMQHVGRLSFVDRSTGFLLCEVENGPFAVTLYRSDDGGESWRKVSIVDSMAHEVGPFEFISPRLGFASSGFGDLRRTTDGGRTFTWVPGTPFEGVQDVSWFSTQLGDVSTRNELMRTDDAGRHWKQMYPALKPQGLLSFTPSGSGIGTSTGWFPGAILSTHNGIKWKLVSPSPVAARNHSATMIPISIDRLVRTSSSTVWAVGQRSDGSTEAVYLLRSSNGGWRWQVMLAVPGLGGFPSFVGSRLAFLSTATPFRIYVSTDAGRTWSRRDEAVHTWNDQFVSASSGWALSGGGALLHTNDGGRRWRQVPIRVADLRPSDLFFLNARDGWVAASGCTSVPCAPILLRTRDAGTHWLLIRLPPSFAFEGYDWVTPHLGYVVSNGGVYRTSDGGVTWKIV